VIPLADTRRGDIEGLRAIAVLLVVAYHAGVTELSGGFIGVDVFFVISGFLITSLLLREVDRTDSVNLLEFWARRIRRILPMSVLVIAVTVVASIFMLEEQRMENLAAVALGALAFCANFVLYFTTGEYLSDVTLPSPLQHYWSLAVEEQFYIVWPLVVYALARYTREMFRNILLAVIVLGGGFSLVASITVTPQDPGAGYYLPHTRVWELLIGAGLAVVVTQIHLLPRHIRGIAGWAGLLAIVWSAWQFDSDTQFPGYAALLPVLGTAAVLMSNGSHFGPERLLSLRPLQYIGARSYSLYLWHWPVLVLFEAQFGLLSGPETAVLVAMSFALSMVTYDLVEQPIRHSTFLSQTSRRTITAGIAVVAVSLVGGAVFAVAAPNIGNGPLLAAPEKFEDVDNSNSSGQVTAGVTSTLPSAGVSPTTTLDPNVIPERKKTRVLLMGDSTLAALRWFEDGQASLEGFKYILDAEPCRRIVHWGCMGREERMPPSAVDALEKYTEDFDVIVLMAGYHSRDFELRDELATFARAAQIRKSKLVILTFKESLFFPAKGSQGERSMYADYNTMLKQTIARNPNFSDVVIADWNYFAGTEESWFRSDGIHTSFEGTLALGYYISHAVAAAVGNPCPYNDAYPCVIPEVAPTDMKWFQQFRVKDTKRRCFEFGENRERRCEGR
jgi:peptidoglycan/LPS O-acetylase OafA/YrhL